MELPSCAWPANAPSPEAFVALVSREGARLYRDLPWRNIDDAYAVLVSEVMLQQTQVKRVLGRWERFLAKFPTPDALASASTSDVVGEWQGLGYNRRALALKRACEICSQDFGGSCPKRSTSLRLFQASVLQRRQALSRSRTTALRCIWRPTSAPCFCMSFSLMKKPFGTSSSVPLVRATCPADNPRSWYYALLDYGAHLKATFGNASRRSAHYTRQSAFEGSRRQKRAEVVRIVLAAEGAISLEEAHSLLNSFERDRGRDGVDDELFASIAADLEREGFFVVEDGIARA